MQSQVFSLLRKQQRTLLRGSLLVILPNFPIELVCIIEQYARHRCILVAGGYTKTEQVSGSICLYDMTCDEWHFLPIRLPSPVLNCRVAFHEPSLNLWVSGDFGNSGNVYFRTINGSKWQVPDGDHVLTPDKGPVMELIGDALYIVTHKRMRGPRLQKIDCLTREVSPNSFMFAAHNVSVSTANAIYTFRCHVPYIPVRNSKFDLKTHTVTALPAMKTLRSRYAAALDPESGMVFLSGGIGINGDVLSSIEIFDTKTESWLVPESKEAKSVLEAESKFKIAPRSVTHLVSLPQPLFSHSSCVVDGFLFVFGGRTLKRGGGGAIADVWMMDLNHTPGLTTAASWQKMSSMPCGRSQFGVTTISPDIFAAITS